MAAVRALRVLAATLATTVFAAPGVFDITTFGAVGDGTTVNTKPIAQAFAAASAYFQANGSTGTVLVPAGVFLSGQIVLLSGTVLSVSPSATLLGSANASDYPSSQAQWAFIYSDNAVGITINGGGVIDGNYQAYIAGFDPTNDEFIYQGWPGCSGECRPRLAVLSNSFDIIVANVTFTHSADWTFQLLNCSRVHVYNWTQFGDERWPNNDGIDIDSSSNVLLEDSHINTADDGVCIKGSAVGGVVANVTVRRCTVRSRSSAVKFGSNCPIPMYNLTFEDLYVYDSNRGLAIQARDGGTISNVTFARILINGTRLWPYHWWGDGSPLYISTMLRTDADPGSIVTGVVFRDIIAYSQAGAVFSGRAPGKTVGAVLLQNVTIVIDKRPEWNYTTASVPAVSPNIEFDPSSVVHPTRILTDGWMSGFYAESTRGLQLVDVNITFVGEHAQTYWGSECVNTSAAGFPVTVVGGSCVPPPPKRSLPPPAAASFSAPPLDFVLASDLSYVPMEDCYGTCSPFRASASAPTEDALAISAAAGMNAVRLRLWVDPSPSTPQGWPGPDYSYANLTSVLRMARRAAKAGLGVWLDFHYSDVWADPGHQFKPAAWVQLTGAALAEAVYNHTRGALAALAAQGTAPIIVQVGNEITNGMLWAAAGEPCSDGGALNQPGCTAANWASLGALVAAGTRAVRSAAPNATLLVHTDLGNRLGASANADFITQWYSSLAAAGAADWDGVALSFYPHWGAGNTTDVAKLAAVAAAFPGKRIVLAETSWPYQGGPAPPGAQFPYSPAGQLAYTRAVLAAVRALGPGVGWGVAWWGGEYYTMASGAGWTSLWDEAGVALPALESGW